MTHARLLLVVVLCVAMMAAGGWPAPAAADPTGPYSWPAGGARWAFVADVAPPVGETTGPFDQATAELLVSLKPDGICQPGDLMYEHGEIEMFRSPLGYDGSYGRLVGPKVLCPAPGNHDASAPGPGATGLNTYFAELFASLPCKADPVPCQPERGYYGIDLDTNRDARPDWFIVTLDSNCGRAAGGTGDVDTASCAGDGEQVRWLNAFFAARHGGQTSGRKCSIAVWHHEYIGSGFFANDDATRQFWLALNHWHNDLVMSGHSHSEARFGPMTWDRHLSPTGSGMRQITEGMGGRSHTDFRVNPAPEGLRYRYNGPAFGVETLDLAVSQSPAGWQGGTWTHQFHHTDGTVDGPPAAAGCWP